MRILVPVTFFLPPSARRMTRIRERESEKACEPLHARTKINWAVAEIHGIAGHNDALSFMANKCPPTGCVKYLTDGMG
jgi:hypothetical protein